MSKLITTEDGYEIRLGQKNPTCYPCCFEGSVCACRSDLCIKHRDNYIREHGKLPQGEGIYLRQAKVMNEEDTSLYGKNREGKVAVEPVPKEVQWWEAQERFENLIGAEFCRGGGGVQAVLR